MNTNNTNANTNQTPPGTCLECGGRLRAIGRSRSNGRAHDDWPGRKYHKKCYKEMRQLAEAIYSLNF